MLKFLIIVVVVIIIIIIIITLSIKFGKILHLHHFRIDFYPFRHSFPSQNAYIIRYPHHPQQVWGLVGMWCSWEKTMIYDKNSVRITNIT